jgi:cell division initiation protein
MALTPVEIRHLQLGRGLLGYGRSGVDRMLEEIADSFETVWRERADLVDKTEALETELARVRELEQLLRATLVSAERSSQELKEHARKEAELIVSEAHAEARAVTRRAQTERARLEGEIRRLQAILRSALTVVEDEAEQPRVEETTDAGIRRLAG